MASNDSIPNARLEAEKLRNMCPLHVNDVDKFIRDIQVRTLRGAAEQMRELSPTRIGVMILDRLADSIEKGE